MGRGGVLEGDKPDEADLTRGNGHGRSGDGRSMVDVVDGEDGWMGVVLCGGGMKKRRHAEQPGRCGGTGDSDRSSDLARR